MKRLSESTNCLVLWSIACWKTLPMLLTRYGPFPARSFLPASMYFSQVDNSRATSAGSYAMPAFWNRSRR